MKTNLNIYRNLLFILSGLLIISWSPFLNSEAQFLENFVIPKNLPSIFFKFKCIKYNIQSISVFS